MDSLAKASPFCFCLQNIKLLISLKQIPHNHLVSNRQLTDDNPDETEDEIAELEQRLKAASLPEHALKAAQKELKVMVGGAKGNGWEGLKVMGGRG